MVQSWTHDVIPAGLERVGCEFLRETILTRHEVVDRK